MEQNPCMDPSSQQFQQQLNQWFEQHGVLDNLRSHLRSVMITALQQTEIRLRPNQKTTPKIQSVNLLVAEYLIKNGCHYTLSVLMSELPALSNFASGAILFHCRPEKGKPREKYRFQESEVVEILNSLGVSSHDENLKLIREYYDQRKEEESLLECLLQFIPKSEGKRFDKRCGSETGNEGRVGDDAKHSKESPLLFFSRISDGELKRAVEEENGRRMRELVERERRIQEYLKCHEEEVMQRLEMAEKELKSRRETIDRELSERQVHLGRIAFQLKDKHKEIMELSNNFAAIKSENVTLNAKLDSVCIELNELREELEKKSEIIERLEAERMSMKCHVQEYFKWKNREGMDREAVTSNFHEGVSRTYTETSQPMINKEEESSQDSSPSSDESGGEAVLEKVKARVEALDSENTRLCEKYLKYKKKYEGEFEVSEVTEVESRATPQPECPTVLEVFEEPEMENVIMVNGEADGGQVVDESPQEKCDAWKKVTVEEERKVLVPTKRQQKNLEYYLQSRSLLEALEKNTGLADESGSGFSDTSLSWSSRIEDQEVVSRKSVQGGEGRGKDAGMRDLSDLECLTLLKEATRLTKEDEGS